jgi:hypothetical protein
MVGFGYVQRITDRIWKAHKQTDPTDLKHCLGQYGLVSESKHLQGSNVIKIVLPCANYINIYGFKLRCA